MHSFNLSTQEGKAGKSLCEFETSLVYRESATKRNPVLKKQSQTFKAWVSYLSLMFFPFECENHFKSEEVYSLSMTFFFR